MWHLNMLHNIAGGVELTRMQESTLVPALLSHVSAKALTMSLYSICDCFFSCRAMASKIYGLILAYNAASSLLSLLQLFRCVLFSSGDKREQRLLRIPS